MSCGSRRPSPSASTPTTVQVDGMNCIGPTARSKRWSPSSRPASVSPMREVAPRPVSRGPRIAGCTTPSAVIRAPPKRPWLLSTWPIAAISCQVRWQDGSAWRITVSARWYAVRARLGTASTEAAPRALTRTPSPAESRRGSSDTDAGASTAPESSGTSGMTGSAAEAAGKDEHRTPRRARVGAHQPRGGDHRQGGQDGDQAESTEGGSPPQTSARSCHRSPPKSPCSRQPASLPNTLPLTSCPITRSLPLVLPIRQCPERHCDRIVTPYDARPALEDSSPTPRGLIV